MRDACTVQWVSAAHLLICVTLKVANRSIVNTYYTHHRTVLINLNPTTCCVSVSPRWRMNATSWRSWRRITTTRIDLRNIRRRTGTLLWKRMGNPNWVQGLTLDRRPSSFCLDSWMSEGAQLTCEAAAGWVCFCWNKNALICYFSWMKKKQAGYYSSRLSVYCCYPGRDQLLCYL